MFPCTLDNECTTGIVYVGSSIISNILRAHNSSADIVKQMYLSMYVIDVQILT